MWAPPNPARTVRLPVSDGVKFVVDQNIRGAECTFGQHGELQVMDGRRICPEQLADADALIIRTATRVDSKLLNDSRVGFVGTTSIGTDHLDKNWLEQRNIHWANAPGCNADAAAQYTLAMIWFACRRLDRKLNRQRVGIVGCGNVGSRVRRLLSALGVETVANDPPLSDQGVEGLVTLDEALSQDIVCLHVPLVRESEYPTHRMISRRQLARMPSDALLLNAARGDVVDGAALTDTLRAGRVHAALDVWPGEPVFSSELLRLTTVATPHVAGYSDDGKWNGTQMVYRAFCKWAGVTPVKTTPPLAAGLELSIAKEEDAISVALDASCFVRKHDQEMRLLEPLDAQSRAVEFDRLRKQYPARRDFRGWSVKCGEPEACRLLGKLGFSVKRL